MKPQVLDIQISKVHVLNIQVLEVLVSIIQKEDVIHVLED
jgi:hypothetical protein